MSNKQDRYPGNEREDDDGLKSENDPFMAGSNPSLLSQHQPHHNAPANPFAKLDNNPGASVIAYCLASISMTVVNKYVVSGREWNLNFLYLAVQVLPLTNLPELQP